MDTFFIIVGTVTPIIITTVIATVRIEHRLTKVETDVKWLKRSAIENNCCSDQKQES